MAGQLGALAGGLLLLRRWATRSGWTQRHLAAVTFGALLTRTITGFLALVTPAR